MTFSFADGLFWLSVACCALAQFFIIRSVAASHDAPEGTTRLSGQRGVVEMMWAVLPAVGLAVLLVFTWRAVQHNASPATQALPQHAGMTP